MRDGLSLLDQCIAFYLGQTLTYDHVLDVLGAVDTEVFSRMLRLILKKDVKGLMLALEDLVMQGRELGQFVTDFTWYLRNLLLLKTSDHMEDVLDISTENMKLLQEEAGMVREDTLMRYIRIFSELSNQMKYETSKRLALEVALIKLCRPEMEKDQLSLLERVRNLEKKLEEGVVAVQTAPPVEYGAFPDRSGEAGAAPANGALRAADQTPEKPAPEDLQRAVSLWKSIVEETSGRFKTVLSQAKPQYNVSGEDGKLYVSFQDFQGERYVRDEESRQLLEQIVSAKIGKQVEVKMVLAADAAASSVKLADISVDEKIRQQIHDIPVEVDDSPMDYF